MESNVIEFTWYKQKIVESFILVTCIMSPILIPDSQELAFPLDALFPLYPNLDVVLI